MRIEDARNRHLDSSLLLLSCLESSFSFLQVKVSVILPCELPDLDEEISQMIFEPGNILIKVEKTGHRDLDLIVSQMWESCFQKICYKSLKQKYIEELLNPSYAPPT